MFCKVCKDAGHPESVYTSHFVKDRPGGKIVCPHLLGLRCRHCGESGHTVKYCTAPPRRDRAPLTPLMPTEAGQRKRQRISQSPSPSYGLRSNNPYDCIANLQEEEPRHPFSWACIAAREPIVRERPAPPQRRSPSPSPSPRRQLEPTLDWAAIMSSDSMSDESVSSGPDSMS
jgi:hypothetical protein